MSYIQYLEELQYDTETEYLNVLRQEAFDPYENEQAYYCEEHDYEDYENACPQCPTFTPAEEFEPALHISEWEPPF